MAARVRYMLVGVVLAILTGCGTDANRLTSTVPLASLSANALTFSPSAVGTSATESTVTLTNNGKSALLLSSVVLSDSTDFTVTTTCGAALAAGGSCALKLQFTPQTAAVLSGTLTLTDNSNGITGAQQVIALSGTGTALPVPQTTITPVSLSYGPAQLHALVPAQTVTLTNSGTAPLAITSTVLSDTADFSLGSATCGSSLPPDTSCTILISFSPQTVGPINGTLTLTSNSGGVSGVRQTVALSGTGLPVPMPQLAFTPTELKFASAVVNTSTAPQLITLSNTGTAALTLSDITVNDTTYFAVASTCAPTLAVNATCTLAVTFDPRSTGPLSGTLVLTDNSNLATGTVQQKIPVSGTGLPTPTGKAVLTPTAGAFGNVSVGSVSTAQSFTLRNSGDADLVFGTIALSDTRNYTLSNGCSATLAAAASCTLNVVFQPQSAGALAATLTVTDNSGGQANAQQVVMLGGTGVAPPSPVALLTPATLAFPDTMQGLVAASQTLTLSNAGAAPLLISGITLSDTQDFTLSSACPAILAPSASCALSVGFQPSTVATFHATVTVSDNSGSADGNGSGAQTATLIGNGTPFEEPRAVASPSTLTFPKTLTNSSSIVQMVTLTNTGTQPLTVTNVALGGTSAAAFGITSGTCIGTIAVGASCTESVVYSPKPGDTSDTANLTFTDDALGQTGSTQSVALSGSAIAEVDTVANFGDSITCGFYATPNDGTGLVWSLEGYAGLFDTYLGVPAQNWCRQGDTAADLSRLWVPFHSTPSSTEHQLFTVMIGTNDAYRYGIPQVALQTYTAEVAAAVSWLAIPNSDKVLANTITQQEGTWSQDVGFGVASSDAGASLTFPVNEPTPGRNLYVAYHVWAAPYGQAGKASIAVDGTVQATVDESQNSGVYIPTQNGTYDTFLVQAVPLGAVGPHTITFRSVGPPGSEVGLLWAGVAQADYRTVDGAPQVLVGYVTNSPSGNQTFAADNYSQQLQTLIPTLVADGMNVKAVNTSRVLDPNTDFVDLLHPNNAGHAKLATAFEQAR